MLQSIPKEVQWHWKVQCHFFLDAVEEFSKNTPTQETPTNTSPRFQCSLLTQTLPVSREIYVAPAEFMLQTAAVLCGHCCHTWVCLTKYTRIHGTWTHRPRAHPYTPNQQQHFQRDRGPDMETTLGIFVKENSIPHFDMSKTFKLK